MLLSFALSLLVIGTCLCGASALVVLVAIAMVGRASRLRIAAEQEATDARARMDRAIELWNQEQAERSEEHRRLKACLDSLQTSSTVSVEVYRQILTRLASMVRADETQLPPRVM